MLATGSTQSLDLNELSPRMCAMIRVLLYNSEVLDWFPAGSVELHFNEKEVHGKVVSARLHTEDNKIKALSQRPNNGKGFDAEERPEVHAARRVAR